jgi:hypothetical protein
VREPAKIQAFAALVPTTAKSTGLRSNRTHP